jgi:hypothetical protein
MLARIYVDTRRSDAATYIQSHARHLATRHRAANCIRWWAIRLLVRVRFYRLHLNATRIQSRARVLLVKARLFYLGRLGRMYVAAVRIIQSVIRGWRIRKRCWPRAKQIDLSTIYFVHDLALETRSVLRCTKRIVLRHQTWDPLS